MPSLTRKVIKGRSYYYARWCQRVGGRPKIVKTAYLGPLENIVQAVETAQQPLPPHTAEVSQFADVAALYDQADQLGLIELIDAQVANASRAFPWANIWCWLPLTAQPIPPAKPSWLPG